MSIVKNAAFQLTVCAVAALAAGMAFSAFFGSASTEPYPEVLTIAGGISGFQELEERFEILAQEKGGVYAFNVLREAKVPANTDLHLLGHAIGDILYDQKGVEGIADCTQDFRNACSHSIVIGALNDYGETALGMIRDACKKAPGGSGAYTMCYHGLGHGVFAFFSYDIEQTVAFCKKTGTEEYHQREYTECVGGMIMELMGGGGHDRAAWLASREKYLDPKRPLAPCLDDVIPEEARQQCLVYLTPRLWELSGISLASPQPEFFSNAFEYCEAIPRSNQELRDACYGGFGKEFLPITAGRDIRDDAQYSDAQLQTVVMWCGYAGNDDGKRSCVSHAVASAFWGGEKDPQTAFRLCAAADGAGLGDACYRSLANDIASYTEMPRRGQLCSQIPEAHRSACAEL